MLMVQSPLYSIFYRKACQKKKLTALDNSQIYYLLITDSELNVYKNTDIKIIYIPKIYTFRKIFIKSVSKYEACKQYHIIQHLQQQAEILNMAVFLRKVANNAELIEKERCILSNRMIFVMVIKSTVKNCQGFYIFLC